MTAAHSSLIPTPAPSCASSPAEYVCLRTEIRSGSDCFFLPGKIHSLPSILPPCPPSLLPSFPPQANLPRSPSSTPRDPIISRRDRAICRAIKNNSAVEGCCSWVLACFKTKSKTYKLAADFFSSPPPPLFLPTVPLGEETFRRRCFSFQHEVCVTYLESNGSPSFPRKKEKGKKQCDQHSWLYIFLPPAAVSQSNESSGISLLPKRSK